jgi:ribosome-binding protein aMBF1 (putative translation factor)
MNQEWTTVGVKKRAINNVNISSTSYVKTETVESKVIKNNEKKNRQTTISITDVRKLEQPDIIKLNMVSKEIASQINNGRMAKGLSQRELDQRCNFAQGTIKNYESCTRVYNANEVNRISKVLSLKIDR